MSEINKQTLRVINNLFRSEASKTMANSFLQMDHLPTREEVKTAATNAGVTESQGYKIIKKLKDNKLITEADGSIPLMRMRLRADTVASIPGLPPRGVAIAKGTAEVEPKSPVPATAPEPSPEPKREETVQETVLEITPQEKVRSVGELDKSLTNVEAKVDGMGAILDKVYKVVNGLAGQRNTPEPAPKPIREREDHDPPQTQQKPSLIQDAEDIDVSKLPRGELEELAKGTMGLLRPQLQLQSPDLQGAEQTAIDESLRKIIVQVTPFSLIAFDRARAGGFEGDFSDFVNSSIQQVFKDRGYALVWSKVDPVTKRIIPPAANRTGGGIFN
jgi:hypothetical protein